MFANKWPKATTEAVTRRCSIEKVFRKIHRKTPVAERLLLQLKFFKLTIPESHNEYFMRGKA